MSDHQEALQPIFQRHFKRSESHSVLHARIRRCRICWL